VRLKKKRSLLELLLVFKCVRSLDREFSVEQSIIYFTMIGEAFHELWQFEIRQKNARNHFIPDPVFQIMWA